MASPGSDILVKLGEYIYSIDLTNEILGGFDDQTLCTKALEPLYDENQNIAGPPIKGGQTLSTSISETLISVGAESKIRSSCIDNNITEYPLVEAEHDLIYQELSTVFLEHLLRPKHFHPSDNLSNELNTSSGILQVQTEQCEKQNSFYDIDGAEYNCPQNLDQYGKRQYNNSVVGFTNVASDSEYHKHSQQLRTEPTIYSLHNKTRYEHPQGICIEQQTEQREINLCQRCKCEVKQQQQQHSDSSVPGRLDMHRVDIELNGDTAYQTCTPSFDEFQTEMKSNEDREFNEFQTAESVKDGQNDSRLEQYQQRIGFSVQDTQHGFPTQNSILPATKLHPTVQREDSVTYDLNKQPNCSSRLQENLSTMPPCQKDRRKLDRGCKIWEFIRNLLLDPKTNPSLIRWENKKDGSFRLIQPKTISKLWGQKKGNQHMNYEKLSRALRYHYKRNVLTPVKGKNLIYKFGPLATGWQEQNL